MTLRLIVPVAILALLSACASAPAPRGLPPELQAQAEARQQAREAALRPVTDWSMTGRVAVSVGRDGGSGRLDWQQHDGQYTVELTAPITRQGWRLSESEDGALLEGLEGGPQTGRDPALLLLEATGWYLPISALADWARGLRAAAAGPAQVQYGPDGRLALLRQDGWDIQYEWGGGNVNTAVELPRRIDARRDNDGREARVKLVVDEWQGIPPAASDGG